MNTIFRVFMLLSIVSVMAFQCEETAGLDEIGNGDKQILSSSADSLKNDPYMLKSAAIVDDELHIEVQYGGGCEDHEFTLVWPEVITMVYPPNFGIVLYHDNKGDLCEALPTEILTFNLTANPMNMSLEDLKLATLYIRNASNSGETVEVTK